MNTIAMMKMMIAIMNMKKSKTVADAYYVRDFVASNSV